MSEYWIVDVAERIVERWAHGSTPTVHMQSLTWTPPGATRPFGMELPEFFARVWGE